MSFLLILLFFLPPSLCTSQSVDGLHFKDNLLEERFGPQNGYATVRINPLEKEMSTCFRTFVDFDRFGHQVGLISFGKFLSFSGKWHFYSYVNQIY